MTKDFLAASFSSKDTSKPRYIEQLNHFTYFGNKARIFFMIVLGIEVR